MSDDPVPSLAEAMIDDIRVWDESVVCRPEPEVPEIPETPTDDGGGTEAGTDGGGEADGAAIDIPADSSDGCTAGRGPGNGGWLMLLLLATAALLRRRRTQLA
jgi:MYXO-CTERM domain-containing protein